MTESEAPVEEPNGYRSRPGWVKSRPENNQHYLDQMKDDPWFPIISRCASDLEEIVPGYNIAQIKAKFGGLRFYIEQGNCPDYVWKTEAPDAFARIYDAEVEVSEL